MLTTVDSGRWALLAVAVGVAATAAVEFFRYPLDATSFVLGWAVAGCAWLLAIAATVAGTLLTFWRRDGLSAILLALVAALGLAVVVRKDLELGYPCAYHLAHRSDFAAAAARGDTVQWMSNWDGYGYGYAHLPTARHGQKLTIDGTSVTTAASLGNGWWFVRS
ncbi:hypothetical protein [Phytohabitans houttuyneae]|uniref:Uncharacterized protein n=1 Tax=Phytohabitans houttuyneae TaxID=1076126 RepID=A0A6V8KNU1_9ACTN|nr:hypothetical protein [Phytohabitans houttuyneae]GFJ83546.1 hypothetical protein Phou_077260 [Phytohabitans houttuyneae]